MEHLIDLDKTGYSSSMMQRLNGFRGDSQHCDFKVKVDSEEIPLHRNVLAAGSDYFNAMLSHDTLENQSGVVEIKEADAESVKKCIDFIYTGKISVSEGKYGQLMHVAHIFQLQQLCNEIAVFLEASLSAESFFVTKKLANIYNCSKLEEKCDQFALENLESLIQMDKFADMDRDYVLFLLKAKHASASETLKCEALIQWVKSDVENRQNFFVEIVTELNVSTMPTEYLGHLMQKEPLVYGNEKCMQLFMAALLHCTNIEPKSFQELKSNPKKTSLVAFDQISKSLQCFNAKEKSWKQMQGINEDMVNVTFSAVSLDDHIYVLMRNRRVYRLIYKNANSTWEQVADMSENHGQCPPATALQGCIYLVGGYSVKTASVENYDPSSNQWSKVQNKQLCCLDSATISSGESIYSIGGHDGKKYLNEVERFNPDSSEWSFLPPMRQERITPAMADLDGNIYVMGGCTGEYLSAAEFFNPSKNAWTSISPMRLTHRLAGSFVWENGVFVVGGLGTGLKCIERYDPEKNEWEIVTTWESMKLKAGAFAAI